MTDQRTTFDDHDPLAYTILHVLESFIDEIGDRECTVHFNDVVDGPHYLKGVNLGQKPERFIEDHLVYPLLTDAFEYTYRPQPVQYAPRWPKQGGIPDFCITSLSHEAAREHDVRFFGEVKPPKKLDRAQQDMQEYLDSDLDVHAIGILTDGFEWELWVRPRNQAMADTTNPYRVASLQDALQTVRRRNLKVESYQPHTVRNRIDTDAFSAFTRDSVQEILTEDLDLSLTLSTTSQ